MPAAVQYLHMPWLTSTLYTRMYYLQADANGALAVPSMWPREPAARYELIALFGFQAISPHHAEVSHQHVEDTAIA